jgi:hypothetical protein
MEPEHISPDDLSEDPRSDWAPTHAPDGRTAYVAEVDRPTVLHADEEEAIEPGDFLVWEDGHYRAAPRAEFLSNQGGWDLEGPSVFQFIPDD